MRKFVVTLRFPESVYPKKEIVEEVIAEDATEAARTAVRNVTEIKQVVPMENTEFCTVVSSLVKPGFRVKVFNRDPLSNTETLVWEKDIYDVDTTEQARKEAITSLPEEAWEQIEMLRMEVTTI